MTATAPILLAPVLAVLAAFAGGASASTFDIVFEPLGPTTPSQDALLDDAARYWETRVPGYGPGIDIDALTIEVGAVDIDGPDNVLGRGGPFRRTFQAGYVLPTFADITFDTADLGPLEANGLLYPVLLHEVAHAMGFGTLWTLNDLSIRGSGAYTGPSGLAAYRAEFDPGAAIVPVDRSGLPGTEDAHWAEDWAGGPDELMTGFLADDPYLSDTTIASFADLGYAPAGTPVPVPLPAALWLALAAVGALGAAARPRRSRPAVTARISPRMSA